MSKILITGCAGLLGANFCEYLCGKGYTVVGIDNLSGGYQEYIPKQVKFYLCDLTNAKEVLTIISKEKPEYIFHFAAYAAAGLSPFVRIFNYENNVIASAILINGAIINNVKKFIFASSMEVYSRHNPPFIESCDLKPGTPYGIAKMAVELDLESAYKHHSLDYAIVRPHNVHGKYQNIWDRYRNVIGIFIRKAINGENLTIYGDGSQIRAFSDIKYYMEPFETLMIEHPRETFNLGADKPTTILELAKIIQNVAHGNGFKVDIEYAEARKEIHTAYCDHSKAKKLLGFSDKTNLKKLVQTMFSWAQTQPNREVKKMKIELENGIYSYWKE